MQSRQLYRRRFGIETSYRQKNQAQAFTTSSDPVYRLLLEGVAYILRQVWPSRDGMATAPRTFTSKRCRAGNCIGAASASKRVIARRTKHKHSRPAVIRFTAYR